MDKTRIRIWKPYDFHLHPRQGEVLKTVAPLIARQFCGGVVMTNFAPACYRGYDSISYRDKELLPAFEGKSRFKPIMTIMLTRITTPQIVIEAARLGVKVLKYIPLGVSTNADESFPLDEIHNYYDVLKAAHDCNMIFSIHLELKYHCGRELPDVEREEAAITYLDIIRQNVPRLNITVEHASTISMIDYVMQCPPTVRATLTAHHARLTYADVYDKLGEVHNPHNYCRPIAKYPWDVAAVINAMISGNRHFGFGSDFAPHLLSAKTKVPPAAGIFNPFSLEMLCQIFHDHGALNKLEGFLTNMETFYGVSSSAETIEFVEEDCVIPASYPCGNDVIVPFKAGETLRFRQVAD